MFIENLSISSSYVGTAEPAQIGSQVAHNSRYCLPTEKGPPPCGSDPFVIP